MVADDDSPTDGQEEPNGSNNGDQSEVKVVNESAAASSSSSSTTNNAATNNASPQQSSKKRRSNIQLNKDDHPEGHTCDDNDDDELNDEGTKRTDPFKRAPDEVLKKRKIVKASSKWSSGGNGTNTSGGMFASVNLAPTTTTTTNNSEKDATDNTPIFGSSSKVPTFGSTAGSTSSSSGFGSAATKTSGGFGSGFGSVANGFGALKPSTTEKKADDKNNGGDSETKTTTGFGSGFGAVSSGFGALKSSTSTSFGFGSNNTTPKSSSPDEVITTDTNNGSGLAGTFANGSPTKKTTASPSKFPISSVVDTDNGEKDEECLCQVRAKLFKMVPEDETNTEQDGSALKGDVPSVPSTTGRMELVKKATKGDGSPEKGDKPPEKGKEPTAKAGPKLVQKEAGIGPVRILKRKPTGKGENEGDDEKEATSARVVQRQETCGGGHAFRVILNIRLIPKTCNVIRRGDKFVQLNAPNSQGELESSLFKVKTTADGDLLEKNLKSVLG